MYVIVNKITFYILLTGRKLQQNLLITTKSIASISESLKLQDYFLIINFTTMKGPINKYAVPGYP